MRPSFKAVRRGGLEMSDPLNVLTKKTPRQFDPAGSPRSVGWTRAHRVRLADEKNPLPLDCGKTIAPVDVEYEIYGKLNGARDNAILICHALSGDAHAAGWSADAGRLGRPWLKNRPGWWDVMIGPGKAFDTDKYCVICSNILGSCYGTTGPSSIDPETGRPYGLRFPVVTVGDWVRLQERLISHLGIDRLLAVAGGSLGGQQALEWALAYPDRVESAIIIASAARLSDQGLAFNVVARNAIMTDPNFKDGDYYGGPTPGRGLEVARMLGHITYLSETSMENKFGRRFCNGEGPGFHLGVDFEVEGYLRHQGKAFVERFDANSYLYITRAMDYYDASAWGEGDLDKACRRIESRLLLVSFSSDWLYSPAHTKELALALGRARKRVSYANIESSYGHDAFLLEVEKLSHLVRCFLGEGVAE
ncbi:MAG: homoserine O-acetyltransferase [Pelotomaculum sp.]|nr:homoserine O-acetyltransferase [Pelotomaculum sp.]